MSRRIEIELTSSREDGTWTWRAAGAREPKGVVEGSILPAGSSVGDTLRVEAEFTIDGIDIVSVVPGRDPRRQPERLEILGSGREIDGVTTSLVPKRGGRGRGEGGERRDRRGDRPDGRRGGDRNDRGERNDRGPRRGGGERSERRERPPAPPAKPKPKRLRPQRTHRNAVLAELPEEQRPVAEQVLRAGIPGLRKAIDDQNVANREAGRPEIDPTPLVQLAEGLLPRLKNAEWHDRADAAIAGIDEIDLRDLRSVVVAADSAARSDDTRALAEQLREAVAGRVEAEHQQWLRDIAEALGDGRTVRALRWSSRPPKAGAPLPADISARLAEAAGEALAGDVAPQRWGTVLDAVAYSPVRSSVRPAGIPAQPGDELLETVRKLSTRVPEIAALFGVEPAAAPRRKRRGRSGGDAPPAPPAPKGEKADPAVSAPAEPVDEAAAPPAETAAEAPIEQAPAEVAPAEAAAAEEATAPSAEAPAEQAPAEAAAPPAETAAEAPIEQAPAEIGAAEEATAPPAQAPAEVASSEAAAEDAASAEAEPADVEESPAH